MQTKTVLTTFVIAVLAVASMLLLHYRYLLGHKPTVSISVQQIQAAMEQVGGEVIVEREATEAILHLGRKNGANASDITNCPAITRMASLIGGEVVGIWPDDTGGIGIPAHVRMRRGTHTNYQFIYIFAEGSAPRTNSPMLRLVSGSVYLRDTSSSGS